MKAPKVTREFVGRYTHENRCVGFHFIFMSYKDNFLWNPKIYNYLGVFHNFLINIIFAASILLKSFAECRYIHTLNID
jgi:hypothetical protein